MTTVFYQDFLQQITGEQSLEKSLDWLVPEFLALKIQVLELQKNAFEQKYQMSFEQYENMVLGGEEHDWEDEKIVWEWQKTLILLDAYLKRKEQWEQMSSKNP